MKSIEIKTTQNVVLQYELAELRDRIIAWVIDIAVVLAVVWGLSIISAIFIAADAADGSDATASAAVLGFFISAVFMFYSLVFEVFNNGQSLGKKAMRIRVIKTQGGKASFPDYAARWVFRMVDIYFSFGAIASILITSSAKGQRLGDIVANTAVVKLQPQMDLKLSDLLAIRSQQSYKPMFTQAKQLIEEDVLLIKSTLDRYKEYPNAAHQNAVALLAARIKEVLSLHDIRMENKMFLQTILNDYVVLTR
jgi:uncharacterized RDD family membrane protein YckC